MRSLYLKLTGQQKAKADEILRSNSKLVAIGFWIGPNVDQELPHPSLFVDRSWEIEEREMTISYLRKHSPVVGWMGLSQCRFNCGEINMGASDVSDGFYVWPEGLAHYIEQHVVRLPQQFIDHLKDKIDMSALPMWDSTMESLIVFEHVDYLWWKSQKGFAG